MRIPLDLDVPLTRQMVAVASEAERQGLRLRLVGGAALLLWGRHLDAPREMTFDLDWALCPERFATPKNAADTGQRLVGLVQSMGYRRRENWRESRSGRFQYEHAEDPVAVEFLCGSLGVGEKSRRPPAWRVARLVEGPPHFYAARTPWIDHVARWIECTVLVGERHAQVEIPGLPDLALLKLKAVRDKQLRTEEESSETKLAHERARLVRHARDLQQVVGWLERRGELPDLLSRTRLIAEIGAVARDVWSHVQDRRDEWSGQGLEPVSGTLRRLAASSQ